MNFSINIQVIRDIATVIDLNDMCNTDGLFRWRTNRGDHILLEIRDPNHENLSIMGNRAFCEFRGDGIIQFGTLDDNKYFSCINHLDLNRLYYSPSVCQKEFKKCIMDIFKIKL